MTPALHLLLVDDDLTTLTLLQKALAGLGEVHTATRGTQALQIVADHTIDLVLLDILMPEMGGFATCRALRQAHPDLAVLFITAASDPASEIEALEIGGHDFINKPINPAVVRARVALHLKLRAQHIERQRIEGQLRASERRFRDLFEHLPIAYQSLDRQGRWRYANQAMADLLGVETPDDLLGHAFVEFCDEATPDQFPSIFAAFQDTGGCGGELRLRRRDGSALTALFSGRVEQDDTGQYLQSHCVLTDISARRAMEEAVRALNATLEQQVERRTADLRAANATLRESEARYRLLYNNIADPIIILDRQGQVLAVNDPACRQYGYRREDFLTLHITDIDTPEDAIKVPDRMAQLAQQGAIAFEAVHRDAGGRVIPVEVRATPLMLDGQPVLLGLCHDITLRKQAEQAITRIRADLERAQAIAHVGSWSVDIATQKVEWSNETYRMYEIEIGTPITHELFLSYVHPEDRAGIVTNWQRAALGENDFKDTFRIIVNDKVKWLSTIFECDFDERGTLKSVFGIDQDITEQKYTAERIEILAYRDVLTGLPNRLLGLNRLLHAVAAASRRHACLAVLYIDLDHFKFINDTYGHTMGDLLLQGVAERLTHQLQDDDLLCRLAADEFMMVVQSPHSVSHIEQASQRLLESLAGPFELSGRQLFITFSIGVAIYPQDGEDGETLMRHANTALFEAKKAGPQRYRCFEPPMQADLMYFVQTRDHLRTALEQGEFELYYQPQIHLHTRRVVGVEALLRWHRPDEGLTQPGQFMAVAEHSGLIVPIGQWVLQEACRQAAAWCDLGWKDFVVAVNLSAVQFRQGQVDQDVRAALEDSGLDPAYLELELTESILLDHREAIIETVSGWKRLGIQLSIDDFGTGYSSLAYLKRFKVDKLKIDRSFITDLLTDEEDGAIVQAILQIALTLNLRVIAEGVDDATLAQKLKELGCDEAQGYLYSKPLPAAEMEQWLSAYAEWSRRVP